MTPLEIEIQRELKKNFEGIYADISHYDNEIKYHNDYPGLLERPGTPELKKTLRELDQEYDEIMMTMIEQEQEIEE